jgi:hypothetical protein
LGKTGERGDIAALDEAVDEEGASANALLLADASGLDEANEDDPSAAAASTAEDDEDDTDTVSGVIWAVAADAADIESGLVLATEGKATAPAAAEEAAAVSMFRVEGLTARACFVTSTPIASLSSFLSPPKMRRARNQATTSVTTYPTRTSACGRRDIY